MTTRTASTMAEFTPAAAAAVAGDVIALKPGIYTGHLYQVRPADKVVITSADPLNKAVFKNFFFNGCANLTVRGVKFDATNQPTAWNLVECGACNGLTFIQIEMVGDYLTSKNHCQGLSFQGGSGNSVVSSRFENLLWAVAHANETVFKVSGNKFLDIGSVGVRGGGSSDVEVTDNEFIGTHPDVNPDWHGDHIQFWTNGTTADVRNIVVARNVCDRGSGTPAQGIFFGQQAGYPFRYFNVTIEDNVIRGAIWGGITADALDGFSIRRNTVQGYSDQESWIFTQNCKNGVVADNKATSYSDGGGSLKVQQANNQTIPAIAKPTPSAPPAPTLPEPVKQPTNSQRAAWLSRAKTIQSKARELQGLAASVVAPAHPIISLMDRQVSDADALVSALADGGLAIWKK